MRRWHFLEPPAKGLPFGLVSLGFIAVLAAFQASWPVLNLQKRTLVEFCFCAVAAMMGAALNLRGDNISPDSRFTLHK
jgi:hypothetical protein